MKAVKIVPRKDTRDEVLCANADGRPPDFKGQVCQLMAVMENER